MTDYRTKQFNKFTKLEHILYDTYRGAKTFQMGLEEFLKYKKRYHDLPYHNKLGPYYVGKLSGIDSCLFAQIQNDLTEWKHYYVNKNGKTVYVNKWEKLPRYIRNNGKFFGNHFWKRTPKQIKNNEEPKPFGNNPAIGIAMK